MKGLHFSGVQDVLALLVRRKWWIVLPFLALSSATILLVKILPKLYVSESMVLIPPRDVPTNFVMDLNAGNTEQRLITIQQRVLSRTNLLSILNEFEDSLPEYRKLNLDEKVLKLNSQIAIKFEADRRSGTPTVSYFRISYQNRNPELAQKIAEKLTSLFIEQDGKLRAVQVNGTTEFMAGEVGKVGDQLKESDDKLKQLRSSRRYTLPDQRETNLRALDRLYEKQRGNQETIDRNNTNLFNLQRIMAETEPSFQKPVPHVAAAPEQKDNSIDEDLQKKLDDYKRTKNELDELSLHGATAKNPDVIAATLRLERLKNQIPPEALALLDKKKNNTTEAKRESPEFTMVPNPAYENLKGQLDQLTTEAAIHERERKAIEGDIALYQQRLDATPQSEQDLSDVVRQNNDLNKHYDKLKDDLSQANLSQSLESRQKGSQFMILDPANYPLTPTKPAKSSVALAGLVFSLLVGIALAVGSDILSQKVWSQAEIESLLGAAILVEIPQIVTDADFAAERKKKMVFVTSVLAAGAVYGVGLYFAYVHSAGVLQQLDPFLQKLYS